MKDDLTYGCPITWKNSIEVAFLFSLCLGPELCAWCGRGLELAWHGRGLGRFIPLEEACDPSSPVCGEGCYCHRPQFILSLLIGWHHRLDGHEFEQAPGVDDGLGNLACCSPRGHRVGHD